MEYGICKGFKPQFPGQGCWEVGAQVRSRQEPWQQTRTSIAAKQNPPVHREVVAQRGSKLPPFPPLPRGAPSRSGDGGGWIQTSSGDVWGGGGSHQHHTAEQGGFYPSTRYLVGQILRFMFMVSLFLVHAEEGGPALRPQRGGGFNGMLVQCWQGRRVCAVRSKGLFQREPSSRANSQSPVGEDVGGGFLLVVSQ